MIREASKADTFRLIEMTTRFLLTTRYGEFCAPDPVRIAKLVDLVLEHGVILVAEEQELRQIDEAGDHALTPAELIGMIALTALPHLLTGEPYAEEQAWWVEPEHRGGTVGPRLMAAAEAWCRKKRLNMLKVIAPEGSNVGAFYVAHGFQPIEQGFVKVL